MGSKKASGDLSDDKKEGTQLPQKKGQPTSSQYKNQSTGNTGNNAQKSKYQGNKGGNNNDDSQAWNKGNNNKTKVHEPQETTGRGPKPGREMDRHSQATTSRKPENKRNGDGKGNWGNNVKSGQRDEWDVPTKKDVKDKENVESTPQKEPNTEATTEGEKKPDVTPVEPKIDPDDEGYGKKTFLEHQKDEAAKLEALNKILGDAKPKPQVCQKSDRDYTKFNIIESEKEDVKFSLKGTKVEASNYVKPKDKSSKPVPIDINEFTKKQKEEKESGDKDSNEGRQFSGQKGRGGNKKVFVDSPKQFPSLTGETSTTGNQGNFQKNNNNNNRNNNNRNNNRNNNNNTTNSK